MARKIRPHIVTDSASDPVLAPKHLTKQEFAKRLYTLMIRKGWHQSELARQSGLPRDSISVYMRGKSLPEAANTQALANALGVSVEQLMPNHVESAIDEDSPALEMKVSPNAPNAAWIRVNRLVSLRTALSVMDLLEKDDVALGGGSRKAASV